MLKFITGLFVAGLIFGLLYGIFILPFVGWHYETARGEHTGYITAVERTGLIFKTNRVYLKTDTQSSQEDSYCVIDQDVYSQLQQYSTQKQHVNAYFFDWAVAGITNCKGEGAIIYKVEPITN